MIHAFYMDISYKEANSISENFLMDGTSLFVFSQERQINHVDLVNPV